MTVNAKYVAQVMVHAVRGVLVRSSVQVCKCVLGIAGSQAHLAQCFEFSFSYTFSKTLTIDCYSTLV